MLMDSLMDAQSSQKEQFAEGQKERHFVNLPKE